MTLQMAKLELQEALAQLATARAIAERAIGNPGYRAELDAVISEAGKQVQCALARISRPTSARPMTGGHKRALDALAAAPLFTLSDRELRAVVGRYATNVIRSLQSRRLIASVAGGMWRLTAGGMYRQVQR